MPCAYITHNDCLRHEIFFDNVAVGIRHAKDVHGLGRIALIDFDVHHGNGSQDIFRDDPRVLMCSTFEQGIYPFADDVAGANMVNIGLPSRAGGAAFRDAVTSHWLPALETFAPPLICISAVFDGHRDDDMGDLGLVEADYAWVTREIMRVARRQSVHPGGAAVDPSQATDAASPCTGSLATTTRACPL